jgi:endonuclease YncB( thermonuclease family)
MRRLRLPGLSRNRTRLILLVVAVLIAAYRFYSTPRREPDESNSADEVTATLPCLSEPGCFTGTVTKVVDGDTLDVSGIRIRLVLVDAPEANTREGPEATEFLERLCPVGSKARVIEDRLQGTDDYGRTLAAVWCGGEDLRGPVNVQMIRSGHAQIYRRFCRESAFATEPWAIEAGCLD